MEQRGYDAALKGVPTELSREEFVGRMAQEMILPQVMYKSVTKAGVWFPNEKKL
jgi:hypothetical protein